MHRPGDGDGEVLRGAALPVVGANVGAGSVGGDPEYDGSAPSGMSRREALAAIALAPLAASFGTTPEVMDRVIRQTADARDDQQFQPKFFTPHEWRTVRVLVDLIIPKDERSGSATDAGVPEFMDFMLMERTNMQTQMRGGLRWIDSEALDRHNARFINLTPARQTAILDEIAWPAKARPEMSHGVAFFTFLRDFTASGFWSSKMGVEDLGYIGNKWVTEWTGCPDAALARLGVSNELFTQSFLND